MTHINNSAQNQVDIWIHKNLKIFQSLQCFDALLWDISNSGEVAWRV